MFTKLVLVFVAVALCEAANDPYASVGTCSKLLLDRRELGFDIDEIANTGNYNYVYTNSFTPTIKCAKAEIHGDDVQGYRGSATITGTNGKSVKSSYALKVLDKGVIGETLTVTDSAGKATDYEFKLIVLDWQPKNGIFYYARCSDFGTGEVDSRSIVISECKTNDARARRVAKKMASLDTAVGYKGPLVDANVCK